DCGLHLFCEYWSLSHLSKSSCDWTVRLPFIPECPKPHSCEHGISYCPVSVDSHHLIHRHVQLVLDHQVVFGAELAVGSRIGDFPVELLSGHLVKHVARRSVLLDLGPRRAAHERQDDQNHRGRGGPYDLEARIAFDILRLAAWTGAVSNQEDHKRYHHRDPDTSTIQKISSNRKSICGPKVEISCGKYMCSSIEAS